MILTIGILIFKIEMDLYEENKKYGYYGFWDNVEYDTWTDEIIPKQEIDTYNNDDKYITNSKGKKIYFKQIKELLKQYKELQGNYWGIKKDKLEKVTNIDNILIKDYLDLDYEVKKIDGPGDMYKLEIKGEYANSYYRDISSASYLEGLVKEVVKAKYREQNNLKA